MPGIEFARFISALRASYLDELAPVNIPADVDAIKLVVDAIQIDVTAIRAITDALPTLSETGGILTTDGTEQNVYVNAAPLGIFKPICVKIDFTNQTAGETVVIRTYYQIKAGVATPILQDEVTYAGLVSPELINIDLEPNRFGVWVTIEKSVGANRDYQWETFFEI